MKGQECKINDVVIIHDDKKSRALWLFANVKKVLLSKDNKVWGATINHVTIGKKIGINRPIYKLYPIEPMKKDNVDIQPKFVDDTKVCEIETLL